MAASFSPSVNIIRDAKKDLSYIVTPNSEKVALQITDAFKKGVHAFTLIGSYGTGKSSFLWALQQTLQNKTHFFGQGLLTTGPVRIINFIGVHQSLIEHFAEQLEVKNSLKGNQKIFDALFQEYEKVRSKNGLLVIAIDEFGKFLEYAAKFDPDRELYFIQQLAEFVNDTARNIILITTLHQNFEAYSAIELSDSQRQEWKKVKGRLKEITFNEPVEQLLILAAKALKSKGKNRGVADSIFKLEQKHHLLSVDTSLIKELGDSLFPLDFISAYTLTKALQRYGQNERSLFTFLEIEKLTQRKVFGLAEVYDYLFNEYYSYLTASNNADYTAWASIRDAIQRCESHIEDSDLSIKIIKAVGLLKLFGSKAAKLDRLFLKTYFELIGENGNIKSAIEQLEKLQVIYFAKYNQSFKIFEGTDVNIEEELLHAAKEISDEIDLAKKLSDHFEFPFISAKAISYEYGTPRFFGFDINDTLSFKQPTGEIDGYVNLILNPKIDLRELITYSKKCEEAILFGYFNNAKQIRDTIFDIEKTQLVISKNSDDRVAKHELENILSSQRQLLSHFVWDALYSPDVNWLYKGKAIRISSRAELNKQLSIISKDIYFKTPIYRNELINKHSISGAIHGARKNFFAALVKANDQENLGIEKDSFPPEKTIYITLLRETKLHIRNKTEWDFAESPTNSPFGDLWTASEEFLESCKAERRPVSDFFDQLSQRPFKMKQGFLEFWIPSFLFIKRDDFALFGDQGYIPELNDTILYLLNRNTKEFTIKTFDVRGVKLNLYNRYREFLQLDKSKKVSNNSFIESIRPFLVLYKQLPEYSRKTSRLSPETLAIRKAIENSQDPEKVFFEDFPKALKTDIKHLSASKESLENYIANLQGAIRELRVAVDELTDRIELFLVSEILGNKKIKFPAYKEILQSRYSGLKEHQLLAKQKSFLMRINSPLDDRKSWIASIVHAVIGKTLETLRDEEEEILKDRLLFMVQEMDNLSELSTLEQNDKEELIKLDLTTHEGLSKNIIRVPAGKKEEIRKQTVEIKKLLGKDKRVNLAILSQLLKDQLK
jgi:hypothetical protein